LVVQLVEVVETFEQLIVSLAAQVVSIAIIDIDRSFDSGTGINHYNIYK
jgi:hypothetical protein